MLSKIWLINVILAVVAAFFGIRAFGVWGDSAQSATEIHAIESSKAKPKTGRLKGIIGRPVLPESAYEVVVSNNLFSPQREASEPGEAGEKDTGSWSDSLEGKRLLGLLKQIILYGVVITDDSKAALVTTHFQAQTTSLGRGLPSPRVGGRRTDPLGRRLPSPRVGEKKTEWVKVGDSLSSFTVADIMADRVLLKAGSRDFDLLMYDKDKPKRREPVRRTVADKGKEKVKSAKKVPKEKEKGLRNEISKRLEAMKALWGTGPNDIKIKKNRRLPGTR